MIIVIGLCSCDGAYWSWSLWQNIQDDVSRLFSLMGQSSEELRSMEETLCLQNLELFPSWTTTTTFNVQHGGKSTFRTGEEFLNQKQLLTKPFVTFLICFIKSWRESDQHKMLTGDVFMFGMAFFFLMVISRYTINCAYMTSLVILQRYCHGRLLVLGQTIKMRKFLLDNHQWCGFNVWG